MGLRMGLFRVPPKGGKKTGEGPHSKGLVPATITMFHRSERMHKTRKFLLRVYLIDSKELRELSDVVRNPY